MIRGVSTYPTTVYDSLWIVRFAADGRAVEFMQLGRPERPDVDLAR